MKIFLRKPWSYVRSYGKKLKKTYERRQDSLPSLQNYCCQVKKYSRFKLALLEQVKVFPKYRTYVKKMTTESDFKPF